MFHDKAKRTQQGNLLGKEMATDDDDEEDDYDMTQLELGRRVLGHERAIGSMRELC